MTRDLAIRNGHSKPLAVNPLALPPQNLEAELGVLGAILLDNGAADEVADIVRAEDFYRDSHAVVYRTIQELRARSEAVDIITLAQELIRRNEFDRLGGEEFLDRIADSVPHAANAKYHAAIVREHSQRRQLVTACTETLTECYSGLKTASELIEAHERAVHGIHDFGGVTIRTAGSAALDVLKLREQRQNGARLGLYFGLYDLDDMISPIGDNWLMILAARPGMGKSALMLTVANHVASLASDRRGVLCFSLEMGWEQLAERLVAMRAKVGTQIVRGTYRATPQQESDMLREAVELCDAPFVLDDAPMRTIGQVASIARRNKAKYNLGLIIVDYIQLMRAEDASVPRQEQVAEISKRLKAIARELKTPVLALSQLNRNSEARADKRPMLADLRESGSIEQDSDIVLLLHRPDYYDANDSPGLAEINVAKNRHGSTGTVRLTFAKETTEFRSLSHIHIPPAQGSAF